MQAVSSLSINWDFQLDFKPDLIVEVTNVCDRSCSGCYAANIFSQKSKEEIYREMSNLFIDPIKFSEFCLGLHDSLGTLSLRGGEPSRHPELETIIESASKIAESIYVETHGRWILEDESDHLLETIKKYNAIVKISFDKMHGLKSSTLEKMCKILKAFGIRYVIAITEKNFSDFLFTRRLCYFEEEDFIFIFQKKVSVSSELVRPKFGILNTSGLLVDGLNVRKSFKEAL